MVCCSCWVAWSALNCAIWEMVCVSSIGLLGSWFCISAIRSFRKSFWPRLPFVALVPDGLEPGAELPSVAIAGFDVCGTCTWFKNVEDETLGIRKFLRRGNQFGSY